MLWGERRENGIIVAATQPTGCPMPRPKDLSRSLAALDENSTLIAVIEMSQSSWLVAATIPGVERQPTKKLTPDEGGLLRLLHRWRGEAEKAGRTIDRIAVAYEAGRDGFWLARWLRGRGIEAYVIHPTSVAVSREHRRAKTDRLDTELLKRAFLGWLRGEPRHCSMAKIPTPEEEDAKRPNRERENLVSERTRIVNRMKSPLVRLGLRGFKPTLRKGPKVSTGCAPRKVCRCCRTRWPSCAGISRVYALSSTRSGRSLRASASSSSRSCQPSSTAARPPLAAMSSVVWIATTLGSPTTPAITRRWSTTGYSARQPRHCLPSPLILGIWAPASAPLPYWAPASAPLPYW